jgi:NADH-quinone oxidoreductase subunit J
MPDTLFYFFAAFTLASALLVVACRNPVNSAMAMLAALAGVAANFFLLQAPFLGVLQILIYAGAVMVLFAFVISLLDVRKMAARKFSIRATGAGIVVLVLLGAAFAWLIWTPGHLPAPAPKPALLEIPRDSVPAAAHIPYATGAKSYGRLLFGKYILPTLTTAFLLLCAMVGVFLLTGKKSDKPDANE